MWNVEKITTTLANVSQVFIYFFHQKVRNIRRTYIVSVLYGFV